MFDGLGDGHIPRVVASSSGITDVNGAAATVRAMGDFDTGYDEVAQAAARQAM